VVRLDFTDLVGQDGDILHLMATTEALQRFQARLLGTGATAVAEPA
jgi:hypothetical protein